MSINLSGFDDSILGQLTEFGIEILTENGERSNEEESSTIPKAIYNISKYKTLDVKGTHNKTKGK